MHVYVINEWKRIFILLNLQRMVDGVIFGNLTSLIIQILVKYGRLSETKIVNKLVSLEQMELLVFMVWKGGWPSNSCKIMFHLWVLSIAWFTSTNIYLDLEQVEFNFQDQMNPYLHPCITILFIVLCGILKLTSLVNFWNPNATRFLKT